MRIAQLVSLQESVPPRGKNGLESMVHYLTEELVRRGHQVTLFATADSRTSARLVPVMPQPAARGYLFGLSATHYSLSVMAKAAEMAGEFDVIHSHLGSVAHYFAQLTDTPLVETVHSAPIAARSLAGEDWPRYRSERRRRAQMLERVFVSRSQRDGFGVRQHASVIPNGLDLHRFAYQPESGDYFAYLGYLTPEKGAHLAVAAARRAHVRLRLAGSYYGCEEYFHQQIAPFLVPGQIEYVGVLDETARSRFLGGARALLFPVQWEEPFGLVMAEALACGTPVIGLRRASVPEVVRDGVTGFVAEDLAGLVRALRRVPELERAACRRSAERDFSVAKMTTAYERVYARAITRKHKSNTRL